MIKKSITFYLRHIYTIFIKDRTIQRTEQSVALPLALLISAELTGARHGSGARRVEHPSVADVAEANHERRAAVSRVQDHRISTGQ